MRDGWLEVALSNVTSRRQETVSLVSSTAYRFMGIRWKNFGGYIRGEGDGASVKASTLFRVRAGDFVFNRIDTDKGAFCMVDNELNGSLVTNEFPTYICAGTELAPEFLWLHFQQPHVLASLRSAGSEGRARWKERDFESHRVNLPPLHEQRRIVDLIGSLDEAIEAADEVVSAAVWARDALAESMIQSAGGPSTSLKDVISIARGGSPRPIDSFITDTQDGLNWIKIGDVSPDGRYITSTKVKIKPSGLSKTRAVKAGDFVLSNSMSFGRPYILAIDGCIHDGWLSLSEFSDSFHAEYLYYLLRGREVQAQFQSVAAGSSVRNLNKGSVGEVEVRVPALEEQARIVEFLRSVDEVQEAEALYASSLRNLRSNLLTALLSGAHEIPDSYNDLLAEAM